MKKCMVMVLWCAAAFGQTTIAGKGVRSGLSETGMQGGVWAQGENAYCGKGTGTDETIGTPEWGATDGVANLPSQCMYTGMDATPSPGGSIAVTYTAGNQSANTTALGNALASVTCGETIWLPAGSVYVAPTNNSFNLPALNCDGQHWITIETTGVASGYFPAEHTQATPCLAGIYNDGTNGYNNPGYPTYPCPSAGTVLTAQIAANSTNQPAIQGGPGATHIRFIGIEITKVAGVKQGPLVSLFPCAYPGQVTGCTNAQGSQFIIVDRSLIHGQAWNIANETVAEDANGNDATQAGISANNSQYVALINSWDYDTFCQSPGACVDSQAYNFGTGSIQDGPHKLYGNVLASAGESWIGGGGGIGPGTPVSAEVEIRANVSMKPLGWMIPIETCNDYDNVIAKNLGEFKNAGFVLIEGNTFVNSWQGCQSDQDGYGLLADPKSQNDKTAVTVDFDGTDGLVTMTGTACTGSTSVQCFTNNCGGNGNGTLWCNPCGGTGSSQSAAAAAACVPSNCPPTGCILQIDQANRTDNNTQYRFCDGANGCYQTSDGTETGTPLDMLTHARILPYDGDYPPSGTGVDSYSCVPGLCPTCQVHDVVIRYNWVENVINGFSVGTSIASHCADESSGAWNLELHDNNMTAISTEMSNGPTPYEAAVGVTQLNAQLGAIVNTVEIGHNTVAIDQGYDCPNGPGCTNGELGGMGYQWDNTGVGYVFGLNWHDNASEAPVHVLHGQGSLTDKGVGGNGGLANTYQIEACAVYFPQDANGDIGWPGQVLNPVPSGTAFTFSPALANYMVTVGGQESTISNATSTGFTTTVALAPGSNTTGTISVRDLTTCNWSWAMNLLGENDADGAGGAPAYLWGAGNSEAPYPTYPIVDGVAQASGVGTADLTGGPEGSGCNPASSFNCNFVNWETRGAANYTIAANSPYKGAASDAAARMASGQSTDPGAGQALLGTLTGSSSAQAASIYYSSLSFSGSTLNYSGAPTWCPSGQNCAYMASLMNVLPAYGNSGGGASPFKSWWVNSLTPSGSGVILGRDGTVGGPFYVLSVSRAVEACGSAGTVACSTFNPKIKLDPATTPVVGQTILLTNFVNGSGTQANDGTFNGTCTITVVNSDGSVSCPQTGTGADTIASHAPTVTGCGSAPAGWPAFPPFACSAITFEPLTAGSGDAYTLGVTAKDGAFQLATGIAVTVN